MRWAVWTAQRGTITPSAIQDDFRRRIGNRLFNIALENAFAQMDRFRGVAVVPFTVLAHVEQERAGIAPQAFARLFGRDFADTGPDGLNQFQKAGRMLHDGQRIIPQPAPRNLFFFLILILILIVIFFGLRLITVQQ